MTSVKQIYNWINSENSILKSNQILKKCYIKNGRVRKDIFKVIFTKFRPSWTSAKEVNNREVFGHWKANLTIGKKAKGYANLLVMTERKIRINFITKVRSKKPWIIVKVIHYLKCKYNIDIKSVTTKNQSFLLLDICSSSMRIYSNANSLIRRKYKKSTDFSLVFETDLENLID